MYHVRIITTGVPIVQVSDGQGNVYPRFLNETLLSKVATKTNLTFKRSTTLWGYEFNYEAIYNVAIDVIDSLLEDDVDGVILIYEQETMSEFAFYLSLFTIMYNKPIVLYSLSVNSQKIAISKRSNP